MEIAEVLYAEKEIGADVCGHSVISAYEGAVQEVVCSDSGNHSGSSIFSDYMFGKETTLRKDVTN